METQISIVAELQDFFRRRAEVELDYSKNLDKLSKSLLARHKEQKQKYVLWASRRDGDCIRSAFRPAPPFFLQKYSDGRDNGAPLKTNWPSPVVVRCPRQTSGHFLFARSPCATDLCPVRKLVTSITALSQQGQFAFNSNVVGGVCVIGQR